MSLLRRLSLSSHRDQTHKRTFYIYESRYYGTGDQHLLSLHINQLNGELRIKPGPENRLQKSRSPSMSKLSQTQTNLKYINNVKHINVVIESVEYEQTESCRLIIEFHHALNIGHKKTSKRGRCWDIMFQRCAHRDACIRLLCRVSLKLYSLQLRTQSQQMKRPKQWISDHIVQKCKICQDSFNAVIRKHHCRSCGNVLCQKCSSHSATLPDMGIRDVVRVCNMCYGDIILNRMRSNGLLNNDELYALDQSTSHEKHGNGKRASPKRFKHHIARSFVDNDDDGDDSCDDNDDHDDDDRKLYYGINSRWRKFIAQHNGARLDPMDESLQALIRSGVPSVLRGYIWRHMVPHSQLDTLKNIQLLDESEKQPQKNGADETEDIYLTMEKDLQRTFPIHKAYKTQTSVNALRSLLRRYSIRNPRIGYCQSMNFSGAILLLFMDENEAFRMFCYLIEKVCCLFGTYFYHQSDILGAKIDGFVFNDVLKEYLPDIHQHLSNLDGVNLHAINHLTFHWFLSLFVNTLSYKSLLCVWDHICCFSDRMSIIFRAALHILSLKSDDILKCTEFYQIHELLSNKHILNDSRIQGDTAQFMKHCRSSHFKDIEDMIAKQRMFHSNRLNDEYIGSQLFGDMQINLIAEYTNFYFGDDDDGEKEDIGDEEKDDQTHSWILTKTRVPVTVQKFTQNTPKRSLSNNRQSLDETQESKNLNNCKIARNCYFQSDDDNNSEVPNHQQLQAIPHTTTMPLVDIFQSSPSLNAVAVMKNPQQQTLSVQNESPRFEAQLLVSKSYHRNLSNGERRREWPSDDEDCILVTSPGKNMLYDELEFIHIASSQ